jgi:hypothetical protein
MSDPNKRYDRRKGNSRTVKITFFHNSLVILLSLGQLFRLFIKFFFTNENDGKVKNRQT